MAPLPNLKHALRVCVVRSAVAVATIGKWTTRTLHTRTTATGLSIIGFFETASGLGFTARAITQALANHAPRCISISPLAYTPPTARTRLIPTNPPKPSTIPARIAIHVYNPDVFIRLILRYGTRLITDYDVNIAMPVWETQTPPPMWSHVLAAYNYIWTPSQFSAAAIAKATNRPVLAVPTFMPEKPSRVRLRTDSTYIFMVVFDHNSCLHRKNPSGAIRAFRAAGERLPLGVTMQLRVKCHANTPRSVIDMLQSQAGNAPVDFLVTTLDDVDMESLWQDCDCLLSLHRSEGFGLVIAEALSRAIPVIATRQGGILDFTDDSGCMLVDGPAVPKVVNASDYQDWSGWIEPDLHQASAFILNVLTNYHGERNRAMIGRTRVRNVLNAHHIRSALDSCT